MDKAALNALLPLDSWQWSEAIAYIDPATPSHKREHLLCLFLRRFDDYIHYIASSRWKQFNKVNGPDGLRDIASAGKHGFVIALNRWSPTSGKPLSRYASKWITFCCLNEAVVLARGPVALPRKVVRLVANTRAQHTRCAAEALLLASKSQRETRYIVREIVTADGPRVISMDGAAICSSSAGDGQNLHELIPAEGGGPHAVETSNCVDEIRTFLLTQCTSRERFIMHALYPICGDTQMRINPSQQAPTLSAIGLSLGISGQRVKQLRQAVTRRLRRHLELGASIKAT